MLVDFFRRKLWKIWLKEPWWPKKIPNTYSIQFFYHSSIMHYKYFFYWDKMFDIICFQCLVKDQLPIFCRKCTNSTQRSNWDEKMQSHWEKNSNSTWQHLEKLKLAWQKNIQAKSKTFLFQEKSLALESSLLSELEQLEKSADQHRRQSLKSICVKSTSEG